MRARRPRAVAIAIGTLGFAAVVRSSGAQQQSPRSEACDGRVVDRIEVRADRPGFGGASGKWRAFAHRLGLHHATTRDELIRRYLLLAEGKPCTELRRAESERILRAQPFLASVRVLTIPDEFGGVVVGVETVDEVPVIVSGGVRSGQISSVGLGNANVGGNGIRADAGWNRGFFYRPGYRASVIDYQFLGRPYIMALNGNRASLGGSWDGGIRHPFFTDLQRVAWNVGAGGNRGFVGLRRMEGDATSFDVDRAFATLGGVLRIGEPGRLSLFGLSLSRERASVGATPVIVTDTGVNADLRPGNIERYPGYRSARINALWGVRDIRFIQARGFETLDGLQDVRIGFQSGTVFGRSQTVLGTTDDDIALASTIYLGGGSARSFVALEGVGQGRDAFDTGRWDGVLVSGRAAWYIKPATRQTTRLSAEFAGGWRQLIPFQLALGSHDGGVRGYERSREAGAQRLVFRGEHRWVFGTVGHWADAGGALFADAGRVWAGDAPFGVDTKLRESVGLSLLAAFPRGSQRLYRVDFAVPVTRVPNARWSIGFNTGNNTRDFLHEPSEVTRNRGATVPTSIFNWP